MKPQCVPACGIDWLEDLQASLVTMVTTITVIKGQMTNLLNKPQILDYIYNS